MCGSFERSMIFLIQSQLKIAFEGEHVSFSKNHFYTKLYLYDLHFLLKMFNNGLVNRDSYIYSVNQIQWTPSNTAQGDKEGHCIMIKESTQQE